MTNSRRPTGTRRRRAATSYRKIAITVPEELAEAMGQRVREQRSGSVSAFVSEALGEKLERDRLQEILDQTWLKKPMTAKERAWADKILGA